MIYHVHVIKPVYISTAGYEVLFDVLHHVVGCAGKHSGVPLHIGHFRSHVDERIRMRNPRALRFFSSKRWMIFVQSGMAARLRGLPKKIREPCCALRYIGGDGTGIGVTLGNIDNAKPVWEPPGGLRPRLKAWGCMDRCAIGNNVPTTPAQREEARSFVRAATESTNTTDTNANLRNQIDEFRDLIPGPIFEVLENWFSTERHSDQWDCVRRILRACSYKDSVCGIVPHDMLQYIHTAICIMSKPKPFAADADLNLWHKTMASIRMSGMGIDISTACIAVQQDYINNGGTQRGTLLAFAALLQYLGESQFGGKRIFITAV
jgi:hypothetical protein